MTLDRDARPAGPDLAVLTRVRDALQSLPAARGPVDPVRDDPDAADVAPLLPLPRRR